MFKRNEDLIRQDSIGTLEVNSKEDHSGLLQPRYNNCAQVDSCDHVCITKKKSGGTRNYSSQTIFW